MWMNWILIRWMDRYFWYTRYMIFVPTEKRTEDFFNPVRRQTRLTACKYSSQTCVRSCTNVVRRYTFIRVMKPVVFWLLLSVFYYDQVFVLEQVPTWKFWFRFAVGIKVLSGSKWKCTNGLVIWAQVACNFAVTKFVLYRVKDLLEVSFATSRSTPAAPGGIYVLEFSVPSVPIVCVIVQCFEFQMM